MDISSWKDQAKQALAGNTGAQDAIALLGDRQVENLDWEVNL